MLLKPVPGAAMRRLLLFSMLWLAVSEGAADAVWVGVPAVLGATAASLLLRPRGWRASGLRLRPIAALRFGAFFAWQSIRGGLDVARRALSPGLPIAPGFVDCAMHLPPGLARILVIDVASLLPGSLSVSLDGDRLRIHVLDVSMDVERSVRALERHAAALFEDPDRPAR